MSFPTEIHFLQQGRDREESERRKKKRQWQRKREIWVNLNRKKLREVSDEYKMSTDMDVIRGRVTETRDFI